MTTNGNAFSVFISYAHEDEALLRQLEKHLSMLKQQGLISTWYDRQIDAGSEWAGEIDARLEQASLILLLVSADFLASRYCNEVEVKRALERHKAGQARVLPIVLRPADWQGAPFAHLQALPTDARPITTWPNQDEAWVNVVGGIRRAIEDLSLLPTSTARTALPGIWNIPYPRNSFFLGRDEILARLHAQLYTGQTTALAQSPQTLAQSPKAISGLGGIGKTQLAIEYAYRYHHDYEAVLWARAETREDLISSYSALATLLNLPDQQATDQQITIEAVKRWLQKNSKWLLILDNADDVALLPPFLPPVPGGHVLLTTRAWDMQRFATRLEVETLPDEQGALLLLRRAGLLAPAEDLPQASADERRLATALTQELGGLPLAPDAIPEEIITEGAEHLGDQLAPVAADPLLFAQAIEVLRAYSLLARDPRTGALSVHRLVQAVLRDGTPADAAHQWKQRAVLAVSAARPDVSDVKQWPACERWLPHALICADWIEQEQISNPEAANLLNEAGYYLKQRGHYREAEPLYQRALAIREQELGAQHPNTATSLNNLATLYYAQKKYEEAEPLLQRALAIKEQQLGASHPLTANSLNNLASLYYAQGRSEEAVPLLQRALDIRERTLGPTHPDTAHSLYWLASIAHRQQHYEQARPLYEQALAIYERALGLHHPRTNALRTNYVALLRAMGREEEARKIEEER